MRRNDTSDECDSNGYFKPRYCRTINVTGSNKKRISCVCVFPNNGTRLRDTVTMFDDTGNDEMNEKRKPRCSARGEAMITYHLTVKKLSSLCSIWCLQCKS